LSAGGALVFPRIFHNQCTRVFFIALLFCLFSGRALAERLPLKAYTTTDGLAHNVINKIVRDSRGLLWFCTEEGLSRFDGYSFTNYGTEHGLPHPSVNDLLETHAGEFWVATNGGLVRFDPKGTPSSRVIYIGDAAVNDKPMFTVVLPSEKARTARATAVLREGRDGTIWCGTWAGLYRLERNGSHLELRYVELGMTRESQDHSLITDLLEDGYGTLWVASLGGLYRRWPDGTTALYTERDGLPSKAIHDLLEDHNGQLWAGTRYAGFFSFAADSSHAQPRVTATYQKWDGETTWVFQLFETSDHRFWIASNSGLTEFVTNRHQGKPEFHKYTSQQGLTYHEITTLNEDAAGNLWLGTNTSGAMKLAHNGLVTYDKQDGIATVNAIFPDQAGGICFRGFVLGDERTSVFEGAKLEVPRAVDHQHLRYGRFDGQRFTWFKPDTPKSGNFGWVCEGVTLQAHDGEWWVGTGEGLFRFPATDDFTQLKHKRPLAVYQTAEGLTGFEQVFRIFEDSRGNIWASTSAGPNALARWERTTGTFQLDLANKAGLPSPVDNLARSFGEDSSGNIWIGFNTGVARFRQEHFTFFGTNEGLPAGAIQYIYSDHKGRLWLALARNGLIRVDDPNAERPTFRSYTTAQGLSSNNVRVIVEDVSGRIYVGTGRGLDRLDPETGRVKYFTTADGLAEGDILAAFRDPDGVLWFGTHRGLSRFAPEADPPAASPPPISIIGVLVAGERHPISVRGEVEISLPDLAPDRNELQIDFVGLSFASGEVLKYQYQLEGADKGWGAPVEQRTVNYARLAPGLYRFLVRAVNSDGVVSATPAAITFNVLPPVWQRGWFLALSVLAVGLAAYSLYRYRVARLVELERVRTRIATDLHDDIGSNLTRISLLSELAKQQKGNGSLLASIADIARESVSSMNDIVWAISPQHDRVLDLTRRMRQHAEDVFTMRDIKLQFNAASSDSDFQLRIGTRRDVLLIFKEAVNNAARHSGCTEVAIDFRPDHHALHLRVSDNGKGFEIGSESDGQGLRSMARRAADIGGELKIESLPGKGTTVRFELPL
jgi:ligand-binding sensor domain-containing protein/signal transduction histidine kinase